MQCNNAERCQKIERLYQVPACPRLATGRRREEKQPRRLRNENVVAGSSIKVYTCTDEGSKASFIHQGKTCILRFGWPINIAEV